MTRLTTLSSRLCRLLLQFVKRIRSNLAAFFLEKSSLLSHQHACRERRAKVEGIQQLVIVFVANVV